MVPPGEAPAISRHALRIPWPLCARPRERWSIAALRARLQPGAPWQHALGPVRATPCVPGGAARALARLIPGGAWQGGWLVEDAQFPGAARLRSASPLPAEGAVLFPPAADDDAGSGATPGSGRAASGASTPPSSTGGAAGAQTEPKLPTWMLPEKGRGDAARAGAGAQAQGALVLAAQPSHTAGAQASGARPTSASTGARRQSMSPAMSRKDKEDAWRQAVARSMEQDRGTGAGAVDDAPLRPLTCESLAVPTSPRPPAMALPMMTMR